MRLHKTHLRILTAILLITTLPLTSCRNGNMSPEADTTPGSTGTAGSTGTHEVLTGVEVKPEDTVTPDTLPEMTDVTQAVVGIGTNQADTTVTLTGRTAEVNGSGVVVSDNIITFTDAGTYLITGALSDGQLVVNTQDTEKVKLLLNGVSVTCTTGPAIYVQSAPKKVVLYTVEDSVNLLADGDDYVVPDDQQVEGGIYPNACIYAKDDLKLDGQGTLQITAHADKGINTSDDLEIAGGIINITSPGTGLRGKDSVTLTGGSVSVRTTKDGDGIKTAQTEKEGKGAVTISGGALYIAAIGDGISAATDLSITGGTLIIHTFNADGSALKESTAASTTTTGGFGRPGGNFGGEGNSNKPTISAKGLKAAGTLTVDGGKLTLVTVDDGIHSDDAICIQAGEMSIRAGDDGIHADKVLTISGGNIEVAQSYEGLEANQIRILGGTNRVTASDDGMNACGGTSMGQGGMPGGFRPGGRSGSASDNNTPAAGTTTITDTPLLTIAGGYTVVNAGGDGLDSNGNIVMTGGVVLVYGPTDNNNGALDSGDGNYGITISGGTLLAVGSNGMAEMPDGDGQAVWAGAFRSTIPAGSFIGLMDADGQIICAFQLPKAISSFVFSSPALTSGAPCTLVQGGTGTVDAGGRIAEDSYTGYTEVGSLTAQ